MKTLMRILFLTMFLWVADSKAMTLELKVQPSGLRVLLLNSSPQQFRVIKRFAYGSFGELEFLIQNIKGEKFGFTLKVRRMPLNDNDWCYLAPDQFVGIDIPLSEIQSSYELTKGRYYIKARYTPNPGDKTLEAIESSMIEVEVK